MIARIALIAAALGGVFLVVREGAVQAADRSPVAAAAALKIAPADPKVLAMAAQSQLVQAIAAQAKNRNAAPALFPPDSPILRKAGAIARDALKRDITNSEAIAIYGVATAARGEARAASIMNASASLSKRDLTTQMWLVEDAGKKNDFPRMLTHIDTALRVSASAQAQLFPVMANVLRNRAAMPDFTALLKKRPPWTEAFLYTAITSGIATENLADVYLSLGRRYTYQGQDLSALMLEQLVAQRSFAKAFAIARGFYGKRSLGAKLSSPDFATSSAPEPFSWQLTSSADFDAIAAKSGEGRGRIELLVTGTGAGVVARQLLNLAPGPYTFVGSASSEGGTRTVDLEWRLRCAETGVIVGQLSPFAVRQSQWVVPTGCRYQWVELYADANQSLSTQTLFVNGVRLEKAR